MDIDCYLFIFGDLLIDWIDSIDWVVIMSLVAFDNWVEYSAFEAETRIQFGIVGRWFNDSKTVNWLLDWSIETRHVSGRCFLLVWDTFFLPFPVLFGNMKSERGARC